jgi:tetratricopeptide (TPR) repeat protein
MGTPAGMGRLGALLALMVFATVASSAAPPTDSKSDETALRKTLLELNNLTGTDPMRGRLKEIVDDKPERTKKLLTVAFKMVKEKDQPFNRNATFLLAMVADNAKEVEIGAHFYRTHAHQSIKLVSERGVAQAYTGLIQMYLENRKYAESEKACKEVLSIEGDEDGDLELMKPLVMRNLVTSIAKQGDTDRALKITEELIKADPKNFLHLALKGRVYREAEKFEDAVKVYLDVIKMVEKDEHLKEAVKKDFIDDYRYLLSGVYVDLNQIDKATDQLKKLLEREPNNPTYNNDLGYIWADRGMNLAEAEKYIRKAIEEDRKQRKDSPLYNADTDKDNSAYLDSLGWVLFKQGKAKEAKPHLLEAIKDKEGQHTEIYDHLAEVHWELGEKKEAIAMWKKAIESASSSKRDQKRKAEIEKKLKKHEGK